MSDLNTQLVILSNASLGVDMRDALYDAISIMNADTEAFGSIITNWISHVPSSINALVSFNGVVGRSVTFIEDSYISTVGKYAFAYCTSLSTASFKKVQTIDANAFEGCTALSEIYFLSTSVPSLVSIDAFASTPIETFEGTIYVLPSMVPAFMVTSNWSTFSSIISGYISG